MKASGYPGRFSFSSVQQGENAMQRLQFLINFLFLFLVFPMTSLGSTVDSTPVDPSGDQTPAPIPAAPGQTYLDIFPQPTSHRAASDLDPGEAPEGDYLGRPMFTLDGERILLTNRLTNNVTVFDWATMDVLANIEVGSYPQGIAVSDDYAVVACAFSNEVQVIDLDDYSVVRVLPTGEQPWVVRISEDGTRAFVACDIDDVCEIIDLEALSHLVTITDFPISLLTYSFGSENGRNEVSFSEFEVTPDGQYLIVGDRDTSVRFFDTTTGALAFNVPIPNCPAVGLSGDGLMAVAVSANNPLQAYQIDLTSYTVGQSVTIPGKTLSTFGAAVDADGSKAFLGISGNSSAFVDFDTQTYNILTSTYTPYTLGTSPDHSLALGIQYRFSVLDFATESLLGQYQGIPTSKAAVSLVGHRVVAYDPIRTESAQFYDYTAPSSPQHRGATESGQQFEGDAPRRVAIAPDGSKAVVTNVLSDNATIVNLATLSVETILPIGDRVQDVAITSDSRWAVVCGFETGSVIVIDLDQNRIVAEVPAGARNSVVSISPDDTRAYVGNTLDNSVSVLELAGPLSSKMAASFDDQVKVIDTATNTIVASLPVGDFPLQIAFDADGSYATVTNYFGDTCSLIRVDGALSSVVGTYNRGDGPLRISYNAFGDAIGISHYYDNTLVSVDPQTGQYIGTRSYAGYGSLLQGEFDETGTALALTGPTHDDSAHFHRGDESFALPTAPSVFDYCPATQVAAVVMPGPDYVTVFQFGTSGVVETTNIPLQAPGRLHLPYPNPYSSQAEISFTLAQDARATLVIYDTRGHRIASLADDNFSLGDHVLIWNGRDRSGHQAPAGVYLVEMKIGSFREVAKVVFTR
jgi:YVTN family beta-propeller protein